MEHREDRNLPGLASSKEYLSLPPCREGDQVYPMWLLTYTFYIFFSFQVFIEKQKGEILGVVIVESGWGSILPTVIIANMMHGGPAEKSGKLNIGDQIMSINGTSLVGLPLSTCQSIIKVPRQEKTISVADLKCEM